MKRLSTTLRTRIGALGASALLLGSGLMASPMMVAPAHAAYGPCDTTSWRDVAHLGGTTNEYKIPARTGNGLSCYMGYRQGPRAAVEALQVAIIICYGGPPAQMIYNSGGADGYYGSGTVDAVKWLQINKLGLSGSADGVYGPQTRSRMEWPHYYERGAILYSCSNPPAF